LATRSTERRTSARTRPPAAEAGRDRAAPPAAPSAIGPRLESDLADEIARGGWEHAWPIAPDLHTPLAGPGGRQAGWTLERMLERPARDALVMSSSPSALDLACGEGWLCHRLLSWGARSVVGIDARPAHLRRAELLRDHFSIPEEELDLCAEASAPGADSSAEASAPGADSSAGAPHDVVVVVGVPERLLTDAGLLRVAARSTAGVCAIECRGSDADAVARAGLAAGFASLERVAPPLQADPRYLLGDRELLLARVGEED